MRSFSCSAVVWGSFVVVAAVVGCSDGDAGAGGAGGGGPSGAGGDADVAETGDDGDGVIGEGGAGGGAAAEPTRYGNLGVVRSVLARPDAVWDATYLHAHFVAEPPGPSPSTCEVEEIGSCWVRVCDRAPVGDAEEPADPSSLVSAGALTLEGLTVPVTALPTEAGDYAVDIEGDRTRADEPFAAGASLRFVAAGDVVPPFDVELRAPARLNFTSPMLDDDLVVGRDEELLFAWDHGPGGGQIGVALEVEQPAAPGEPVQVVTAQCSGDVVDGALVMPPDVLGSIPASESAHLIVFVGEESEVTAGDWRVYTAVLDVTWAAYGSVEVR